MASVHKDLLTMLDWTPDEVRALLDSAANYKKLRLNGEEQVLKGRSGVMIFEKPSLRTRITFETAIHELGGHPINLSNDMVGLGKRESIRDVARNLERWVHLIVARVYAHATVRELAENCSIPVINALCDRFHPCQALAFGQTIREHRGVNSVQRVVFIGDGNNVCTSIMIISALLGWHFTCVCPSGYEPPADILAQCEQIASRTGATVEVTHDVKRGLAHATVVYTDVWASMGQEHESDKRRAVFSSFQVNSTLLGHAPDDVLVSHCLPAHRGEEITSDILDAASCVALDEAENRLHAQKAIIAALCSKRGL